MLSVCIQLAVVHGYGRHKADLTKSELSAARMWFFVAQTPYKVVVCLNKMSVILLYRRIFITRTFKRICWVAMGVVVSWSVAAIMATIFQCIPIKLSWDKTVIGHCFDKDAFWVAYAVGNVVSDGLVLILPIPMILRLQLKLRDKLMLCAIFSLGGFVTVTSILRTTAVSNSTKSNADITYNFITRGLWTLIEANLGIICACLPVLKQPLSRMFPQMFGSTQRSHGYYRGSPSHSKAYQLQNVSHGKQGLWTGSGNGHMVSISGPEQRKGRKSDEQHIISASLGKSESEGDSTSDRHDGIRKEIDLARVSIHEESPGQAL